MADTKNDQPLASQTIGAANGKDVLYGWLVGRAAADLGLAQAIAASESQRAEQIKRLEEALLGQPRKGQSRWECEKFYWSMIRKPFYRWNK